MDDGAVDLGISGLTGAVEVARGGFSTIYRATQATMERTVAVKLIHATVVDPVAEPDRASDTARVLLSVDDDPSVAPLLEKMVAGHGYRIVASSPQAAVIQPA